MKYSNWPLSLNVFLSFCFLSLKTQYSTCEMHTCRVYLQQAIMGKSNQTIEKIHTIILLSQKVTQLVAMALVAIRKKKKLVKVKP